MRQLTVKDVQFCRQLITLCRINKVTIQAETRYIMMCEFKIMKITGDEVCFLGGKGDRKVVCVVTPTEVEYIS